jgi:purine-binding chemotaxis protein CheW
MSQVRQYSTFFADGLHFGVAVDRVQEALLPMPTTSVPLTTDIVDGLINLRGQIVTAIDLRARLNLPRRATDQPSVSLILRTANGLISLRVDYLGDVLDRDAMSLNALVDEAGNEDTAGEDVAERATPPEWEALPDRVRGPLRELVQGVLKLDQSLLLILDPDLLADPEVCLQMDETGVRDEMVRTEVGVSNGR